MTIKLDIVTVERLVYSEEVDMVTVPGKEGQMGILPHHAPLMSALSSGDIIIKTTAEECIMAISGGFMEVRPDRVIILADTAERAEEIDLERAEAAKKKAQEALSHPVSTEESASAEAALRRALARIEAADRFKKKKQRQMQ